MQTVLKTMLLVSARHFTFPFYDGQKNNAFLGPMADLFNYGPSNTYGEYFNPFEQKKVDDNQSTSKQQDGDSSLTDGLTEAGGKMQFFSDAHIMKGSEVTFYYSCYCDETLRLYHGIKDSPLTRPCRKTKGGRLIEACTKSYGDENDYEADDEIYVTEGGGDDGDDDLSVGGDSNSKLFSDTESRSEF
jgi:hypothetical protein